MFKWKEKKRGILNDKMEKWWGTDGGLKNGGKNIHQNGNKFVAKLSDQPPIGFWTQKRGENVGKEANRLSPFIPPPPSNGPPNAQHSFIHIYVHMRQLPHILPPLSPPSHIYSFLSLDDEMAGHPAGEILERPSGGRRHAPFLWWRGTKMWMDFRWKEKCHWILRSNEGKWHWKLPESLRFFEAILIMEWRWHVFYQINGLLRVKIEWQNGLNFERN